ncbi:MAG: hypothetical protein IKF07_04105 [Eubacterium sp.]|nr:hypothetical protein [Eubacterium sp.]
MIAMKMLRQQVDMIAVFHKNEPPEPYKFRYTRDGKDFDIKVDKVLDITLDHYGNTRNYTYRCQSIIGRRERVFELKYIGSSVTWELYKI